MASVSSRDALNLLVEFSRPCNERKLTSEELVALVDALDDKDVKLACSGEWYDRRDGDPALIHDLARFCDGKVVVDAILALIDRAKANKMPLNSLKDGQGWSLLHYAAMNKRGVALITQLTEIDVDSINHSAETPLMLACTRDEKLACAEALIERGARVRFLPPPCTRSCCEDVELKTALQVALEEKALKCAKLLIEKKALYRPSRERLSIYYETAKAAGPEFEELISSPENKNKRQK